MRTMWRSRWRACPRCCCTDGSDTPSNRAATGARRDIHRGSGWHAHRLGAMFHVKPPLLAATLPSTSTQPPFGMPCELRLVELLTATGALPTTGSPAVAGWTFVVADHWS